MDLFNDINFNDNDQLLSSKIIYNDIKEIAKLFIKNIDWIELSYEIYEEYLIIIDKEYSVKNKAYKTIDGIKLPYNPDSICAIFKFNKSYTQIEYIQAYQYSYSTNKYVINDDDFYIIKFANILYDKYDIITQKIIYWSSEISYVSYNNTKQRFGLVYNKKRQLSNDDYKLSNEFATNFPKLLTVNQKNIADIVYIRNISIQDEQTFISLLSSLLKQFNKIMLNVSTTYINNIPLYKYDTKNLQLFNILLTDIKQKGLAEEYVIITKDTINKLKQVSEKMNNTQLYKSLIESIAVSIKRSLNEDRYDYAHNNSSTHLKERLNGVLMKKFGKSTFFNKSARRGNQDFIVRNINALMDFPSVFSVAVAERKKSSEDNFRINISRKGELDILSDDNIKYILFPRYIGTSNIDYIVYMLKKEDVQNIYDNLTSILNRCKEEIKQGKRDRKTIKVNKSISDNYKNFLAPTAGGDGVCLSNNCLKELSVFTFKLYDNMY